MSRRGVAGDRIIVGDTKSDAAGTGTRWMDLLYWHTPELSDEEVVDKALEYRLIAL